MYHWTSLGKTLNDGQRQKKLIITSYQKGILTALFENGEAVELQYEADSEESLLGNIYVGRVEQVVKNIDAAFLSFGKERTGYYSLKDNKCPCFLNPKNNASFHQGDLLLVQVSKEPVKTKEYTLTSDFSLTGRYAVLTVGNNQMSISGKITDMAWRDACKEACKHCCTKEYGFIVRTNAGKVSFEVILKEMEELADRFHFIREKARCLSAHSLILKAPVSYLKNLRDVYDSDLTEILTDKPEIYDGLKAYLSEKEQTELLGKLSLYQDSLQSLFHLYSLKAVMESALKKRVWLRSGANLVIESTEALTVIDVNTGKYSGKKNVEETRLIINKEAAKEIAKQLRLRNISGIIIVDFINMDSSQSVSELLDYFTTQLRKDPVRTYLAGMTNLGLAEVTRQKGRKPFAEQLMELEMCEKQRRKEEKKNEEIIY